MSNNLNPQSFLQFLCQNNYIFISCIVKQFKYLLLDIWLTWRYRYYDCIMLFVDF